MADNAQDIWRGNPISDDHEPDPRLIVEYMNALALAAGLESVSGPIAIFWAGQSNVSISIGAIGGNRDIPAGVFIRNNDLSDPFTPGDAWVQAEFGVAPLDKNGGLANSLALQNAIAIKRLTGRDVYLYILARGGHSTEAFTTDATLSANGWTRSSSEERLVDFYPNALAALAEIPSPTPVTRYSFFGWAQGNKNMKNGDTYNVFADKTVQVFEDMQSAGLIDQTQTRTAVVGVDDTFNRLIDATLGSSIATNYFNNSAFVSAAGVPIYEDDHWSGEGVTALGLRSAASMVGEGGPSAPNIFVVSGGHADLESAYLIEADADANTVRFSKYSNDGLPVLQTWDSNHRRIDTYFNKVEDGDPTIRMDIWGVYQGPQDFSLTSQADVDLSAVASAYYLEWTSGNHNFNEAGHLNAGLDAVEGRFDGDRFDVFASVHFKSTSAVETYEISLAVWSDQTGTSETIWYKDWFSPNPTTGLGTANISGRIPLNDGELIKIKIEGQNGSSTAEINRFDFSGVRYQRGLRS